MSSPVYIPIAEAARLEGLSRWAYLKRIQRLQKKERGITLYPDPADGRRKRIRVVDLSAAALERWLKENQTAAEESQGAALEPATGAGASLTLFQQPAPGKADSAAADSEALKNYKIIAPIVNGDYRGHLGRRLADGRTIQSKSDFVQWLAEQHGKSPSTLWSWRKRYCERGLAGLGRRARRDKGTGRALSEQERFDLAELYRTEGSARGARREYERQKGRKLPLYVVQSFIRSLPEPLKDRGRLTEKQFNQAHLSYIPQDTSKLRPNEKWVFDHMRFDFHVNAWGKAARPWLTAIMDMRARFIVGWCVSLQPDRLTIASALRMALLGCGIPEEVLLDNGKDFRARYLAAGGRRLSRWRDDYLADLPEQVRGGIFDKLGVRVRYCMVYHPQSKPVERFFRTLHEQFDSGIPGYCGRNPSNRPDAWKVLIRAHGEAVKAGVPEESPLLPIELVPRLLGLYLGEYHRQSHCGLRGRMPAQVYKKSAQQLTPEDANLLLLEQEARKVERCGVRLFGQRYEDAGLYLHNDHTARVHYDPHRRVFGDLGEVLVNCCGQVIRCRQLGEPKSQEELAERLRERRQLQQWTDRALETIRSRATVISSGERRLRELRALLPPGLDPRAALQAQPEASLELDDGPEPVEDVVLPDYGAQGEEFMRRAQGDD